MDVTIRRTVKLSDAYFPAYTVDVDVLLDEKEHEFYNTYGAWPVVELMQQLHGDGSGVRTQQLFRGKYVFQESDVFRALEIIQQLTLALERTVASWKQALSFAGEQSIYIETPELPADTAAS